MTTQAATENPKKTHAAITEEKSALSKYQEIIVGKKSFLSLVYFEVCMWLGKIPGALGLILRKLFWPRLFASCGKGVLFAPEMIIRHPHRIHIGNRVVFSEGCILDARNSNSDNVIDIGDDVIFSNGVMISCKNGCVRIGNNVGLGAYTVIQSTTECPVSIGNDVMIGPRCYIVGGGTYNIERLDIPMWKQGIRQDGGVKIEDDIWLGSNVTIIGGVTMERGSVAAAGAVVNKSVPERAICGGVPAKIIKYRTEITNENS